MKEVSYRVTCKVDYNEGDGIVEHDFYFTFSEELSDVGIEREAKYHFFDKNIGFYGVKYINNEYSISKVR